MKKNQVNSCQFTAAQVIRALQRDGWPIPDKSSIGTHSADDSVLFAVDLISITWTEDLEMEQLSTAGTPQDGHV